MNSSCETNLRFFTLFESPGWKVRIGIGSTQPIHSGALGMNPNMRVMVHHFVRNMSGRSFHHHRYDSAAQQRQPGNCNRGPGGTSLFCGELIRRMGVQALNSVSVFQPSTRKKDFGTVRGVSSVGEGHHNSSRF